MLKDAIYKNTLTPFKNKVDLSIKKVISSFPEENDLSKACSYALTNGGKRLRPIIALLMGESLKSDIDIITAAMAVEFFHTASLIADDLPCMDDDSFRRDKEALHKVFPESVSLLASYTLMAMGYEYITKNARLCKEKKGEDLSLIALEKASQVAGINGATNGQFLDLFPKNSSLALYEKIIEQKTVTLFDLSFSLGWIFGGGELSLLPKISRSAYHFGMAFQIADDLLDMEQDKQKGFVSYVGYEAAEERFHQEIQLFVDKSKRLGFFTQAFEGIIKLLDSQVVKTRKRLV